MRAILAVAELRLREGSAARLAALVPLVFVAALLVAGWAPGADAATRAANADEVVLWIVGGTALVLGVVVPAIGLPSDVKSGAAHTLLAAPLPRLAVVVGGAVGYGALTTLVTLAMAGAGLAGLEAGGLGSRAREPSRPVAAAQILDAGPDGSATLSRDTPSVRFAFRVPERLPAGGEARVRLAARGRIESDWDRGVEIEVSVHGRGEPAPPGTRVAFKAGTAVTVLVPLGAARAGEDAEMTVGRVSGGWALRFPPGSVEVGGAPRLFTVQVVAACLCAAPLFFLLAALAGVGAARFAAPTALGLALFLGLVLAGQDVLRDGARYLVEAPAAGDAAPGAAVRDVSPARVALARATLAVVDVLPPLDAFDRTEDLVERRALTFPDLTRSVLAAVPGFALLVALAWLALRRRELLPG